MILNNMSKHAGNNDYRDAFSGSQQAIVTVKTTEQMYVNNECTINMTRPLAKYKFISTDYEQFIKKTPKAQEINNAANDNSRGDGEPATKSISPDDNRVVSFYPGCRCRKTLV